MMRRPIGVFVIFACTLLVVPLAAHAQPQGHIPSIGVLSPATSAHAADPQTNLAGFLRGLRELGYVDGQTVRLESRYAEWQLDRLPALATELVRLHPDLLFTFTFAAAHAAKQATTTIPIVVGAASGFLEAGLVVSLNRPGGNLTGLNYRHLELTGKRLELLKSAVPTITHVAVLANPGAQEVNRVPYPFEPEARSLGLQLHNVEAAGPGDFDAAFAAMEHSGADALIIMDHSLFSAHRQPLLAGQRQQRLATGCAARAYAEAGCLLAYGPNLAEMGRRAAVLADKILHGVKPGDLPVEQPATFDLVINLKTAEALGLTIPPILLFQATEVLR